MEEKDQKNTDPHLNTLSKSGREKHISFGEGEGPEKTAADNKPLAEEQQQWGEETEEGKKENQDSRQPNHSPIPMHEDDTLGIP